MGSPILSEEKLKILTENPEFTKELLKIHLGKPRKVDLFYKAFQKFTAGGIFRYTPTFSAYALFVGFYYFLYRKLYKEAGILFLIQMGINILSVFTIMILAAIFAMDINPGIFISFTLLFVSFGFLAYIGACVTAKYLYIKKFLRDTAIAGLNDLPNDKVKTNLSMLGGVNTWVIAVFIVLLSLACIIFIIMFLIGINAAPADEIFYNLSLS